VTGNGDQWSVTSDKKNTTKYWLMLASGLTVAASFTDFNEGRAFQPPPAAPF